MAALTRTDPEARALTRFAPPPPIETDPPVAGNSDDTPVLGNCKGLPRAIEKYGVTEIIVSIGTQRGDVVRCVIEAIRPLEKRPELKIAPSLDEMLRSHATPMAVRSIKPADLLNRGVVRLDEVAISKILERKRVLVTGAGGSIGQELCRAPAPGSASGVRVLPASSFLSHIP